MYGNMLYDWTSPSLVSQNAHCSHFGKSLEYFGVLGNDCKGEALGGELFFQSLAMNDQ